MKRKPMSLVPLRNIFLLGWVALFLLGCKGEPHILKDITVTPVNKTVSLPSSVQYSATGNYADGETENLTKLVTWEFERQTDGSSDTSSKFSSLIKGLFYPQMSGIYTIKAKILNPNATTSSSSTNSEYISSNTQLTIN